MAIALDPHINQLLQTGTVIPAHPLALTAQRQLDEHRQGRLTRYYIASGAGGAAVGVHTTQFQIRKPEVGLLEPVLRIAAEEVEAARLTRPFIKVAGVVGNTDNALREAQLALQYGYHLALVSLGGVPGYSESDLIDHVRTISGIIPVFGFYLQPAVGGRVLSYEFWRRLADIPNVYAIKIAAFNRYQTLDVVRAVCSCDRRQQIALYTGNDDNIVADLLTPYRFYIDGKWVEKRFAGGLLGHWAVWTRKAVELLGQVQQCVAGDYGQTAKLLATGAAITDMNAALFDAKHSFRGCIPGIHEVLRRQGLLGGTWCLDPTEELSPGQTDDIDRIYDCYPHLRDDAFVKNFIEQDAKDRVVK